MRVEKSGGVTDCACC